MKAKRDTASLAAAHVHFRIPPRLAAQVDHAAFACRTTKRALWIAAMREYLGEAKAPGQVVPALTAGTEARAPGRKRA
jgi:hypothetical protein